MVSIQLGMFDDDPVEPPPQDFPNMMQAIISGAQVQLTVTGRNMEVWNGQGTVSYFKTAENTARLSISMIEGSPLMTTHYTVNIPDLTFDRSDNAVAGDQGAIVSFRNADDVQHSLPPTTASVTIIYR